MEFGVCVPAVFKLAYGFFTGLFFLGISCSVLYSSLMIFWKYFLSRKLWAIHQQNNLIFNSTSFYYHILHLSYGLSIKLCQWIFLQCVCVLALFSVGFYYSILFFGPNVWPANFLLSLAICVDK